jgi:hypothetical protein
MVSQDVWSSKNLEKNMKARVSDMVPSSNLKKSAPKPTVLIDTCNSSTQEAEVKGKGVQ